ncbi:ATP-binding cassette domain-containing protein [Nonomuraea sp. NPDC050691]|uniref:ATP-binding cassette domain-containing protein n=1 Tax=Nonomuraea sp. NPDC050691 TaxID=3155661 RepID=UPI0033FF5A3E
MSVRPGERLGIVGENGSGESTLLRAGGDARPQGGRAVRRPAARAGAGPAGRRGARGAAAGRTDQPPVP